VPLGPRSCTTASRHARAAAQGAAGGDVESLRTALAQERARSAGRTCSRPPTVRTGWTPPVRATAGSWWVPAGGQRARADKAMPRRRAQARHAAKEAEYKEQLRTMTEELGKARGVRDRRLCRLRRLRSALWLSCTCARLRSARTRRAPPSRQLRATSALCVPSSACASKTHRCPTVRTSLRQPNTNACRCDAHTGSNCCVVRKVLEGTPAAASGLQEVSAARHAP
jgi:hypothetical protein